MTHRRLDTDKFLEDLTGRHARLYIEQLDAMLLAVAMGNAPALRLARQDLNTLMRETMGVGEILGASIALQEAAPIANEMSFSALGDRIRMVVFAHEPTQTILPRVTFDEAVEDMVSRTPVTIRSAAERTSQAISQLYSEGRNIAFARSAEAAVTERAKKLIVEMIRDGVPEVDAGRRIVTEINAVRMRTREWTQSYARMVFRTNVNTAVTAGRFRQMRDPRIKRIMPALEYNDVGDVDTRDNHHAADGVIMLTSDERWSFLAPPLGFNCRCTVRGVGVPELQRLGRIDSSGNFVRQSIPGGAHPDEGFRHRGRPDLLLVGASR